MFYYKRNQLLDLMQKGQSPLISGSASSSGAKATQRVDMFHLSGPAQLLAQGFIANLPLLTIKQTVTRAGNSNSVPGLDLSQPCFSARLALRGGQMSCSWPRRRKGTTACPDVHWDQPGSPSVTPTAETHSTVLAWKIPWTKETGGLQSMGCKGVGHDLATRQQLRG